MLWQVPAAAPGLGRCGGKEFLLACCEIEFSLCGWAEECKEGASDCSGVAAWVLGEAPAPQPCVGTGSKWAVTRHSKTFLSSNSFFSPSFHVSSATNL